MESFTPSAVFAIDTGRLVLLRLVIPAIVKDAAVLVATAHVLLAALANVTSTTCGVVPVVPAVAVQPLKPVPSAIVGLVGTVSTVLFGNVTVTVPPAASAPPAVSVVKPTVQVDVA